jgi:hypothetical protein
VSEPARILLVVTGDLEEVALGEALRTIFPSATFGVTKAQGFTSTRLRRPTPGAIRSRAENLAEGIAAKLLRAAAPHEPGSLPYDYAVAVEDVELENDPEEDTTDEGVACILAHLALGVEAALRHMNSEQRTIVLPRGKAKHAPSVAPDADRRRDLRERCSFHLLRPMAEALFFGEPAAIGRAAGRTEGLPPIRFDPALRDIERFETDDAGYLAVADNPVIPWATANRRRHPKHYLQYVLDPSGTVWRAYKEREHGKRALAALDWQAVVAPSVHARMVRALLADVADMVGASLPWCAAGPCHPLTQRRSGGCLRNVA